MACVTSVNRSDVRLVRLVGFNHALFGRNFPAFVCSCGGINRYGVNLYLTQQPAPEDYLSSVQDFRLQPGVIVEVIGGPGVLIETSTTSTFVSNPAVETRTLTALLFNYAGRSGSSDASSNTTMTGGIQYDGGVEGSDGDSGCFSWGAVRTVQPFKMEQPTRVVCRGLPSTMDA